MYYIYKIENKLNHKVYIGQTINPQQRKTNHLSELLSNKHTNPYLQKDFNKFGEANFEFIILDSCDTKDRSLSLENYYMDCYGGVDSDSVYNVRGNGRGRNNKEYAKRLSKSLIPTAFTGHCHSDVSKHMISETLKKGYREGRYTKVGMCGTSNPFYGKQHSLETRNRISERRRNHRKYTSEFIDVLITEHNKGLTYKQLCEKYNISKYTLPVLINHKDLYLKYGSNVSIKEASKKCND